MTEVVRLAIVYLVAHLKVHVIPRHANDRVRLDWNRLPHRHAPNGSAMLASFARLFDDPAAGLGNMGGVGQLSGAAPDRDRAGKGGQRLDTQLTGLLYCPNI